jgi:hypothetical protein
MTNLPDNKIFTGNRLKDIDLDGLPLLQRLIADIAGISHLADFSVDRFAPALQEIVDSHEIPALLRNHLERYSSDPRYTPVVASNEYVHILTNDLCQLYIGTLQPAQTSRRVMFTSPCNFLFAPISRGAELRVVRYRLPNDWRGDQYEPAAQLTLVDEFTVGAGQLVNISRNGACLDGQGDGVAGDLYLHDFIVDAPIVWLRLASQASAPYQWVFDKDTLRPSFMSCSSVAHTRNETIIGLLNSFQESGSFKDDYLDVLQELTRSPLHHIRWSATQALFSANMERGLQAVDNMAKDPHPQVMRAAHASIQQLKQAGVIA